MKLIPAVLLLLCVSFPAFSQPAAPVPASPPPVWTIERSKSTIEAKSFDKSGKPFTTTFQSWTAEVAFDPENPAASRASVTVDVRSATTGDKTFTDYLVAPAWYDPEVMPLATYQVNSFTKKSDTLFTANGTLYVYNKAKTNTLPIPGLNLPVHITIKKVKGKASQAQFLSSFTFAIPDFSIPAPDAPVRRNAQRKINVKLLLKAHSGK